MARPRSATAKLLAATEDTAVVASGQRVAASNSDRYRRLAQPWQTAALDAYENIGEAWYAAQFYSRAMGRLRVYVAQADDAGELKEVKDMSDPAVEAYSRVKDASGGQAELQSSYGLLLFLTGDGYLTVTADEEADREVWEFLSPEELRIAGDGKFVRRTAPTEPGQQLTDDDGFEPLKSGRKSARVYRLWRRHPRFSALADSPMRGVLPLFEELKLLELAVRARATSRLAAAGGRILLVPDELTFATPQGTPEGKDPFMHMLELALTTPIKNPGVASAVVPPVIRGPAEYLKEARALEVLPPSEQYEEMETRKELIGRIATGLDMPPEILLGMADANHWSAWQIDDQVWAAHLAPVATRYVNDLTGAVLHPLLRDGKVADWEKYRLWYDEAAVVSKPDKAQDAKDVYDRGGISIAVLREAVGFNDEDAQDEEEHKEWLALQFKNTSMLEEEFQPDQPEQLVGPDGQPLPPDAEQPEDEAPDEDEARDQQEQGADSMTAAALVGAAALTMRRARELAGSRCRTRAKRVRALVASVEALGPLEFLEEHAQELAQFGDPLELVAGAANGWREMAEEHGVPREAAARLAQVLETHAARTLPERGIPGLPRGFAAQLGKVL